MVTETEDVPAGTWCWLAHHDQLLERLTEPRSVRIGYVRKYKPPDEVATRLKWMRPVRGKLPRAVVKAEGAYKQTQTAYVKARKAYNKAVGLAVFGARVNYDKAWDACIIARHHMNAAIKQHLPAIERLHAKECPGCPWDGKTLFPKKGGE